MSQISRKRSFVSTAKTRLVLTVVCILAAVERFGGKKLNGSLYKVFEAFPFAPWRVERLRQTVSAKADLLFYPRAHPLIWLADAKELDGHPESAAIDQLSKYQTIHVFVEVGASLPPLLTSKALRKTRYTFYSFSDISKRVTKAGLRARSRYAQLRDRYNDVSSEGLVLFQEAQALADTLSHELIATCFSQQKEMQTNEFSDVLSAGIFDQITNRLTLAECYNQALKLVPKDDAVLFVASSDRYLINGWSLLSDAIDDARTFAIFGRADKGEAIAFRKNLITAHRSEQETFVQSSSQVSESLVSEQIIVKLRAAFFKAFSTINCSGNEFAAIIGSWASKEPVRIIAHAGDAIGYNLTLQELGKTLISDSQSKSQEEKLIFIHCAAEAERNVTPKLLTGRLHNSVEVISLEWFANTIDKVQTGYSCRQDLSYVLHRMIRRFPDKLLADYANLFVPDIARFLETQIYWIYSAYAFSSSLSACVDVECVLASPSRQILVRAFCAGLLSPPIAKGLVIDVQSLNILPHPKYIRPLAAKMMVIDDIAARVYENHFGVNSDDIHIVGNAATDVLRRQYKSCDQLQVRKMLSIPHEAPVVLFISQLQPMERMRDIAGSLADIAASDSMTHLIVKLHPRETAERAQAYKEVLDSYLPAARFTIAKDEQPLEVIAVSDVCVTIYSNMARDAAVLGRPVIVVDYHNWKRPIRFEDAGLAQVARSKKELQLLLRGRLKSGSKQMNTHAPLVYLQNNRHLTQGSASQRILQLINDFTCDRVRLHKSTDF